MVRYQQNGLRVYPLNHGSVPQTMRESAAIHVWLIGTGADCEVGQADEASRAPPEGTNDETFVEVFLSRRGRPCNRADRFRADSRKGAVVAVRSRRYRRGRQFQLCDPGEDT